MRIVALNIRHGGGKRIHSISDYLARSEADVVVISEFRENPNADVLRNAMRERGLEFSRSATKLKKENSVCIISRFQFDHATFPELGRNQHRVISATFPGLTIYGVYFPQQQAKAEVFDFLLRKASETAQSQLVLGDFNTGLHKIDEVGATFHCADRFQAMATGAYVDCWRSRNPDERVFTWYSSAGNGFRIDHAFAHAAVDARVKKVDYDHTPRETGWTDHSALIVEVGS